MKYGAIFPQYEVGSDPVVLRDYIQAVEGMGYDYLVAYDHVLGANPDRPGGWRGPYTHKTQFHEVFTFFAWAAAFTTRLEFVTGILILPQRQTALVAKQAAQIDVLSGGRFRLGVGIGWNEVEYVALNEAFNTRGKRSEEQVEVLRLLFENELVKYEGQYHHIDDAGLNPMPTRRIPIWFGGMADVVLQRMARLGDGWLPNPADMNEVRDMVGRLRGYLEMNNRRPEDFGIDMRINASRQAPSEWEAYVSEWQSLGATHAGMNTMGAGFTHPDQHLQVLRDFAERFGIKAGS